MTGFERLKEQIKDQKDLALKQTVDYLLSRSDMEHKFLNKNKNLDDMCKFIREKGLKHYHNGWNYITNELVYTWAVMYFSLPNSILKIKSSTARNAKTEKNNNTSPTPNNVISLDKAKEKLEKEKKITQLSLFGGDTNE